jgi:hypothetical protein
MTITINGTGTITGITAGGLPDAIITQAELASGVAGNGPAFSAYQSSAQTLTANTFTKIQLQTEEFDTASAFDNATNYRFLPSVAGYYQVNGSFTTSGSRTYNLIYVYKNGSSFKVSNTGNNLNGTGASISALIYLNGSTDYIELYGFIGVTQALNASLQETYFQASMVRAA